MGMTDPIADMLTRIRNGSRVHFKSVDVLSSRINLNMAKVLKLYMKYPDAKRSVITGIERVSKPGRRVYVKSEKIPKVLSGYGISILSTSKGIMTDKEARELSLGGELLCNVW
jgi:small subunit ribosomal protein S8